MLQDTLVHDGDLVGHGHRFDLVMSDIDRRGFVLKMDVLQLGAHLLSQLGVERSDRLIHQQSLGPAHERPADRDALHVATGQGRGPFVQQSLDAQRLGDLAHALVHHGLALLRGAQRKGDVLVGGEVRIQREQLEHESDIAVGGLPGLHRLPVDQNLAAVDVFETGDGSQRSGLAAPRRPQQHEKLPVPDLQVELADDVVVAEVFLDVFERDVGHSGNRDS